MTLLSRSATGAKAFLEQSVHISAPDDWLQACVDWIHEEHQQGSLSQSQVNDLVYEQWLVSDLRDIEATCLPNNVISTQKTQLNGFYCLQVDSVLNVGSSFYSQLQRVTGTENANAAVDTDDQPRNFWEPKPSRMLMLSLTDGSQDVRGMEYKPIPQLSEHLRPGTKLLVSGPVTCRLGVLMLSASNVKVLGGEVDTLVEQNAQHQLLARVLNVDISKIRPTEHSMYKDPSRIPGCSLTQPGRGSSGGPGGGSWGPQGGAVVTPSTTTQPPAPVQQQQPPPRTIGASSDQNNTSTMGQTGQRPSGQTSGVPASQFEDQDEDDFLDHMDVEQLDAFEQWDEDEEDMLARMPMDTEPRLQDDGNGSGPSTLQYASHVTREEPGLNSAVVNRNTRSGLQDSGFGPSLGRSTIVNTRSGLQDSGFGPSLGQSTSVNTRSGLQDSGFGPSLGQSTSVNTRSGLQDSGFGPSLGQSTSVNGQTHKPIKSPEISTKHVIERGASSSVSDAYVGERYLQKPRDLNQLTHTAVSGQSNSNKDDQRSTIVNTEDFVDLTDDFDDDDDFEEAASVSFSEVPSGLVYEKEAKRRKLEPSSGEVKLDTPPYTYLSKVQAQGHHIGPMKVKVKAFISTLLGKLDHNAGTGWTLRAKINDGTAATDVDLGDQLLTNLIGFPASEVQALKANKKDKVVRERISQGIKNCQLALIEMSGLMELEISQELPRPKVVHYHLMTEQDLYHLKARTKMQSL
ncbi:recQ-mediated genome instability protein 1 isoform X2 [Lingula anatina]|uniref:RecQ-mediated genome instability protein 1 n=1 Tax=Lingula anatina TaxID=7574 RepID=A0A1S3JL04_LINAN|nr:recQ-mediated genome instability protein 1 isoform X2 [Lingula anatina]|eukprot:XP_013410584.1 recQ-mediated genome instability protein 1 isoform X2 [Lingula anatina]